MYKAELIRLESDILFNWFHVLFLKSIERLEGESINNSESKFYRQEFIKRFYEFMVGIQSLSKGSEIYYKGQSNEILLAAPIISNIRSALEVVGLYHFIYSEKNDTDLTDFYFKCWMHEGYVRRQNLVLMQDELLEIQRDEESKMHDLRQDIQSSRFYDEKLNSKLRSSFTRTGKWFSQSNQELLSNAGISTKFAKNIYNYFSMYSHSSSASFFQTAKADYEKMNEILKNHVLGIIYLWFNLTFYSYSCTTYAPSRIDRGG
jgi:hypothetical protein